MTFDARETSAWSGQPVELYDFRLSHLHWRYSSGQQDVTVGGATYQAVPISRTSIDMSHEVARSSIKVTVQRDNPVADLWRVAPPSDPVTLTLREMHDGDADVVILWIGRVINVEWGTSTATIVVDPTYSSVKRQGMRRKYSRSCPHVLYGPACRLNAEIYGALVEVGSISGLTISASAFNAHGDGYYAGGYVSYEVGAGIFDLRYIVSQVGAVVTLSAVPNNMTAGQVVTIYPGCDHTMSTCSSKFGNVLNYGGQPYIPTKNPYGGDPIF